MSKHEIKDPRIKILFCFGQEFSMDVNHVWDFVKHEIDDKTFHRIVNSLINDNSLTKDTRHQQSYFQSEKGKNIVKEYFDEYIKTEA